MRWHLFILAIVFFSSFSLAFVEVKNSSIKKNYNGEGTLSGKVYFNIKKASLKDTLEFGPYKVNLFDFLRKAGKKPVCSSPNCEPSFKVKKGGKEITVTLEEGEREYFGFFIDSDNGIEKISDVRFNLTSDFKESEKVPIIFYLFGEEEKRVFNKPSDKTYFVPNSCYSSGNANQSVLLLSSTYCQKYELNESAGFKLGAYFLEKGKGIVEMSLLDESGDEIGACQYDPEKENSCFISVGDVNWDDSFYACIRGKGTTHKLGKETEPPMCGYIRGYFDEKSNGDFGIFVKALKFGDASGLNFSLLEDGIEGLAEEYIDNNYPAGCNEGCFLPVGVEGVSQSLKITNPLLEYTLKGEGDKRLEEVYLFDKISPTFSFSGEVDIRFADFKVKKSGEYTLRVNSKKILDLPITVVPKPGVNYVYPLTVPAGVKVALNADYSLDTSSPFSFKWVLENRSITTKGPSLEYTFTKTGKYEGKVSLIYGTNSSDWAYFYIDVVSPRDAILKNLAEKEGNLKNLEDNLGKLSREERDFLYGVLNLQLIKSKIKSVKESLNSSEESSYIRIAGDIFSLDVPKSILLEVGEVFLLDSPSKIDLSPIGKIVFGNADVNPDYADIVSSWQKRSVFSDIQRKSYYVNSRGKSPIASFYSVKLDVEDSGGFFLVADVPPNLLRVVAGPKPKESEGESVFEFENGEGRASFFVLNKSDVSFYVSPNIGKILIDEGIDFKCNFNRVCEEDLGENSYNCRSDCKPVYQSVFYFALTLILAILIYTILQIWYKKNYERFLFGEDKSQIYNLIMFITNAQNKGIPDSKIYKMLASKGWAREKIAYALKKSRGKNTGMPEIIPVEKILKFFRNRKLKKLSEKKKQVVPLPARSQSNFQQNRPYFRG